MSFPAFEQDRVGDGELADVVQRCRLPDPFHFDRGQAEPFAEQSGGVADSLCVFEGLVVAVLGRQRELAKRLQSRLVELGRAVLQLRRSLPLTASSSTSLWCACVSSRCRRSVMSRKTSMKILSPS